MRIWIALAALIAVIISAVTFMRLTPPGQIVLAAGPEGGAYVQIAERYRDILKHDGIDMRIVFTEGAIENSELLSTGQVDAAILQGGIGVRDPEIEVIGTIFYETLSFLVRADSQIGGNPGRWRGLRINSGSDGSGTAATFRDFERAIGLSPTDNAHVSLSYSDSVDALLQGALDIAVFVAPFDAPYLVETYDDPRLKFLRIDHAEAISRRMSYAETVQVPTGGVSLEPLLPGEPLQFIALKASLAISGNLHPALVNRLTMAAIELHRARGVITDYNTFPSVQDAQLPINNSAHSLIVDGPSVWHDWLPYWLAAQVNRVLLLLLPFFFIVIPLLRVLPAVYAYFMRWRVWQHYPEIGKIEVELAGDPSSEELDAMEIKLHEVEDRIAGLRLPAAYRQGQYDARLHIGLIQKRIDDLRAVQVD